MLSPFFFLLSLESAEDRQFLERLYQEYHRLMYVQALQITRNSAEAQDAVSDAVLALLKKIDLLRTLPCNKLQAYIVITVKHMAINRYHRAMREGPGWEDSLEEAPAPARAEDQLLEQAGVERIKNAVLSLPAREKDIMLMKYFRELTDEEIAKELCIRPVSVRVHISRARKHLAELLQREEGRL